MSFEELIKILKIRNIYDEIIQELNSSEILSIKGGKSLIEEY